jgi:hypothetical protein
MSSDRDGKLIEAERGRVGVRFERRLAHPPERCLAGGHGG